MTDFLFLTLLIANIIVFIVVAYNLFTAPRIRNIYEKNASNKKVSVLIPARNEEKNINSCLDSVIGQSYYNIEIIVLDDNSEDSTRIIVEEYLKKDSRIKLIKGEPLPPDWLGKNWACSQLSKNACGDILLFIDADVRLGENALSNALNIYESKNVKMLSVFSTQLINNIGTQIIVPLMNWVLLMFLPLKKVYSSRNNSFVAANGQFIMIDKNVYESFGGHESVRNEIVEDMEIARILKRNGNKIITALGGNGIFCKMYDSFADSLKGFSKNFFTGFNIPIIIFIIMLVFFQFSFMLPFILVFWNYKYLLIVLLIILQRIFVSIMSGQNVLLNLVLHPLQMIMVFVVGINSIVVSKRRSVEWKGRKI